MGLNTPAIILNDRLHDLKREPRAGAIIYDAVCNPRGDGWTPIGVTVGRPCHSSAMQIVAVGGNTIRTIGFGDCRDDDVALLKKLADRLGYRVVKKPERAIDPGGCAPAIYVGGEG